MVKAERPELDSDLVDDRPSGGLSNVYDAEGVDAGPLAVHAHRVFRPRRRPSDGPPAA